MFIEDLDGTYSRTWLKDAISSNAADEFPKTIFTLPEITQYESYYKEIQDYVSTDIKIPRINSLVPIANMIRVPINDMPYQFNRIFRSLLFVSFARKTGIMISKITFYMAAFECLFTSNNQKVTKRITNRSARFLSGSALEIEANRVLVNQTYDIRSLFFHGEKIHLTPEELKLLSIKIDDLTRKIMKKVMLRNPENEIFTIEEDEQGKVAFESYFQTLNPDHASEITANPPKLNK